MIRVLISAPQLIQEIDSENSDWQDEARLRLDAFKISGKNDGNLLIANETGCKKKFPTPKLARLAMIYKGVYSYSPKQRRTFLPGPLHVQVQTIDRCNASCVMCPHSAVTKTGRANHMEKALYSRILDELGSAGTVRSFTPMLQNEPLMDRDIAERMREAREILGAGPELSLVTNGAFLTPERVDKLIDSNLNTVSVSIDAFHEKTYRSIRKGLDFSKVLENVHSLLKRKHRPRVITRFLKQKSNAGEREEFTKYWRARGADVLIHSVNNRAGTLDSFNQIKGDSSKGIMRPVHCLLNQLFPFCPQPFFALAVKWNGLVILCCHDWGSSIVVGDLSKQSLEEVWNSEVMNCCRDFLCTGLSGKIVCCSTCSYAKGQWNSG